MSLFPAYAGVSCLNEHSIDVDIEKETGDGDNLDEAVLLGSSEESCPPTESKNNNKCISITSPETHLEETFYRDVKIDYGNLRVSTLYYPGRPEYRHSRELLGRGTATKVVRNRAKRYFERLHSRLRPDTFRSHNRKADEETAEEEEADCLNKKRTIEEFSQRIAHFQTLLSETPHDELLWLQFIDFQERYGGGSDGCVGNIAEAALTRCPQSERLLKKRLDSARLVLPADQYLTLVRDLIAKEREDARVIKLWCALCEGVVASSALCSAQSVREAFAATIAVPACRRDPYSYPQILYRYGLFLRGAGLWEQLVLLIELISTMNFSPSHNFPPSTPDAADDKERRLNDNEAKIVRSGLPLSAVWSRVEEMRAAAHWRATRERGSCGEEGAEADMDPQRRPLAADVADMLIPVTGTEQQFILVSHILRLAKVPLLPHTELAFRTLNPSGGAPPPREVDEAAHLLPLLWEAPPGTAAAPSVAKLLAVTARPPHYFTDEHGYLSWLCALWDACCGWFDGDPCVALACWRLRWHTALLRVAPDASEGARVRKAMRPLLRALTPLSPLPFGELARLESAASLGDEKSGVGRPLRIALDALRSAEERPQHERLYLARIVYEVEEEQGSKASVETDSRIGLWALCCSVLGRRIPPDDAILAPPSENIRQIAYQQCIARCDALWSECVSRSRDDVDVISPWDALLPSPLTEWPWCLVALSDRSSLNSLRSSLESRAPSATRLGGAALTYHEAASAALAKRMPTTAPEALRNHPNNAAIAYVSGGVPLWCGNVHTVQSLYGALGALVRPLSEAVQNDWRGDVGRRALRALRRYCESSGDCSGSPLLWAMRLEAEARVNDGHPTRALYLALDAAPHNKWLYVFGARVAPTEAEHLADLLLEKQLRLHALPEELRALDASS